jgi:hypothetical protein
MLLRGKRAENFTKGVKTALWRRITLKGTSWRNLNAEPLA